MTNLPALREAVARLQSVQCTPEIDPGVRGWIEDGKLAAAALAEVRGLLTEIWHSIPSSYDEADPMVQRHARALNALQAWAAKETP